MISTYMSSPLLLNRVTLNFIFNFLDKDECCARKQNHGTTMVECQFDRWMGRKRENRGRGYPCERGGNGIAFSQSKSSCLNERIYWGCGTT